MKIGYGNLLRKVAAVVAASLSWFAVVPVHAGNGDPWIPNEWNALSGIVVSTQTIDGKEELNPLAPALIKEAVSQGLKVVIADRGAGEAIIDSLKNGGVIDKKTESLVSVTDKPLQNMWARDTGPIFRFYAKNPAVTGTLGPTDGWSVDKANVAYRAIAQALGNLRTVAIPTFEEKVEKPDGTVEKEVLPISADGGNWLPTTLHGQKLLLTTVGNIYYGDPNFKPLVDPILKKEFGIDKVVTITPIAEEYAGYLELTNNHLDLYVRTLPGGKVFVADVPTTNKDPLKKALNKVAQELRNAGFQVVRIMNTQTIKKDGKTVFTSYTNSVPINGTWLIPSYDDPVADAAAREAYQHALGAKFKIVSVDVSQAAEYCGALRCAMREIPAALRPIPVLPSAPKGREASSRRNPQVSFDPTTGSLDFSPGTINWLGSAGAAEPDPTYATDPLMGATLAIEGLTLNPAMSEASQYAFLDGQLRITRGSIDLLTADIPTFVVNGDWPEEALNMAGVLANLDIAPDLQASAWLQDYMQAVIDDSMLLPEFFAVSSIDLISLSNGFQSAFPGIEIEGMGIVGNENINIIAEPTTFALMGLGLASIGFARKKKQI